ncbi:Com family DNA-binding transcriptional regulator [Rhodobium orientis]
MESIRCSACDALLFKADSNRLGNVIEIKCRRCGDINRFGPPARPEKTGAARRETRP